MEASHPSIFEGFRRVFGQIWSHTACAQKFLCQPRCGKGKMERSPRCMIPSERASARLRAALYARAKSAPASCAVVGRQGNLL